MFCENCGNEVSEKAKICTKCGCAIKTKQNKKSCLIGCLIACFAIPFIIWLIGILAVVSVITE